MSKRMTDLLPLVILLAVWTSAAVYLVVSFARSKEDSKRLACPVHLGSLAAGMRNYSAAHQDCLPPAYVIGPDGKPWHSWRILILPYIGEYMDIYKAYRFDEPWNGPNNSKLAARMPRFFACEADPDAKRNFETNYFAIVGPGTAFPDDGRTFPMINLLYADEKPLQFPDGRPYFKTPNRLAMQQFVRRDATILLVESAGRGVNWLEPRDIPLAEMENPKAAITARHRVPFLITAGEKVLPIDHYDDAALRRMCLVDPDKKPDAPPVGKAFAE